MGIEYDGGMIVGCYGDDIRYDKDKYDSLWGFIEENDIESMSDYYDASAESRIFGIRLQAKWSLDEIDKLKEEFVKAKEKLEPLFGAEVFLFGTQNIW